MFALRFEYRFEAAHRFTKTESIPCMTPHGHTWKAALAIKSPQPLNSCEMVEEFGVLKKDWKQFLTAIADHSFFHHAEDPILPALWQHVPSFRSLPFPGDPTTEMIAACFLKKAYAMGIGKTLSRFEHSLRQQRLENDFQMTMEIFETPTNSIALDPKNLEVLEKFVPSFSDFEGWWEDPAVDARWIRRRDKKAQSGRPTAVLVTT